jgi:ribonuclease P protein component
MERLKSRKLIELLFRDGKSIAVFPLRLTYYFPAPPLQEQPRVTRPCAALQAGFTVSSKTFKKATDRNRIKRLLRENYRKQKTTALQSLCNDSTPLTIFIMYTGKEMPEYELIENKMTQLLGKLVSVLSTGGKP